MNTGQGSQRPGTQRGRLRGILSQEVLGKLDELDHAAHERDAAGQRMNEASARCKTLVIWLLKAGVPRSELVDRPFSSAWLTKIQNEENLSYRRNPQ